MDAKSRLKNSDADVVMVITTDGMENASREWRLSDVRKMIKDCEETLGWKFLYLAADDASFNQHSDFGMNRGRSVKTGRGSRAHEYASDIMSAKLGLYRQTRKEADLDFTEKERQEAEKLDEI